MTPQVDSLFDLAAAFPDEQACINHLREIRWRDGEFCPHCGGTRIYYFSDRKTFKCGDCRQRFSIKVGTIFEDTKLPLRKWFMAIWLITNHPKGIASTTLAKDLKITQKSAWFVMHRLRHAATTKSFNAPLRGVVEVDETFVGGKARNRHIDKRGKGDGTGGTGKAVVAGAVERKGDVVARVVDDVKAATLTNFIRESVSPDVDLLVTDQWVGYKHVGKEYPHAIINHAQGVYVDGDAHTNSIESVWALLKRQIVGIHHWVSPKHLDRYVQEMSWRFNRRDMHVGPRMNDLFAGVEGRLKYKELIA
jgi:transposase-like protein